MKIYLSILAILASQFLASQSLSVSDPWLSLLDGSQINKAKLKQIAAHFPSYATGMNQDAYAAFKLSKNKWISSYSDEVKTLLAMPEIKAMNVTWIKLGLDPAVYPERMLEQPDWTMYRLSGISHAELAKIAPHFPVPIKDEPNDSINSVYDALYGDWKALFPDELQSYLDHPAMLKTMNRKPTPAQFKSTISAEKDRFLFLKSSSKIKPIIEAFTTGNAALDKARYEAYLKKWYYENDKDYYYHYYAPEELMRYQKERSKGK